MADSFPPWQEPDGSLSTLKIHVDNVHSFLVPLWISLGDGTAPPVKVQPLQTLPPPPKGTDATTMEKYTTEQTTLTNYQTDLVTEDSAIVGIAQKTVSVINRTMTDFKDAVDHIRGIVHHTHAGATPLETLANEVRAMIAIDIQVGKIDASMKRAHRDLISNSGDVGTPPGLTTTSDGSVTPAGRYVPSGGGGAGSVSSASFLPGAPAGAAGNVIRAAAGELGTRAGPGYSLPGKPYNINDLWCSSFATWAWKKAGFNVHWTNPNYVPSVWSDAQHMGLAGSVSSARPGDLIIMNNDGHIGVVASVSGTTITTVEGDTGGGNGAVLSHTYDMSSSYLDGVVHTPPTASGSPTLAV